jgi:hypothetical protein
VALAGASVQKSAHKAIALRQGAAVAGQQQRHKGSTGERIFSRKHGSQQQLKHGLHPCVIFHDKGRLPEHIQSKRIKAGGLPSQQNREKLLAPSQS